MKKHIITNSIPKRLRCNNCNNLIINQFSEFDNYFSEKSTLCNSCGKEIDWWKILLNIFKQNYFGTDVYSFLGTKQLMGAIQLKPEQSYTLRFEDLGIPSNSRVLYINYTPNGNLIPLEIHQNIPHRKIIKDEISLYPMPISEIETEETSEVIIMIIWIENSNNDSSLTTIVDAFEAFSNNKYQDMVLPANVAIESALLSFLSHYISKIVGENHTKKFLNDAATYSNQLNVVLPIIANSISFPHLNSNIRGLLNKLRKLRNEIAHSGNTQNEITKADAAELLCATLFGLRYVSIIEKKLVNYER